MSEDKLLTTKEAAVQVQVSERWITKQIQDGKLKAIDLGKGYRIRQSELDRFLEERETKRDT